MKLRTDRQDGFHVVELVIIVVLVGVIGFAGYKAFGSNSNRGNSAGNDQPVSWAFDPDGLKWFVETGAAPTCEDPFIFDQSPVDLSKLLVIGMPGAYRGYDYKPHGVLRLANPDSGSIDVVMPADATLVGLTRYYEGNPAELQYLLTFETDCGIAFRFDHLYSLAPAFQTIAEKTPEPKLNDTRTDPNIPFDRKSFKAGDLVATAVGFPSTKNFGFDFGVYDYRQPNQISQNETWAGIHNQYQSLEWFGTCWIDQLPGPDAAKAKELSLVVINPQRPNIISDYCAHAPYKTLDVNDGRPTDG